eukprot:SAG31_NODE_204_length_20414_cov_19.143392_13_plen_167_part_00
MGPRRVVVPAATYTSLITRNTEPLSAGGPPSQDAMPVGALGSALEDRLVADFDDNGFCVVPRVLRSAEALRLREAILAEQRAFPQHFRLLGQSRDGGPVGEHGRWQSGLTMYVTDAFDSLVAHPAVLQLVRRLVGTEIGITGLGSSGIRDTPAEAAPKLGDVWPVP